jgi:hypothetical protein
VLVNQRGYGVHVISISVLSLKPQGIKFPVHGEDKKKMHTELQHKNVKGKDHLKK